MHMTNLFSSQVIRLKLIWMMLSTKVTNLSIIDVSCNALFTVRGWQAVYKIQTLF